MTLVIDASVALKWLVDEVHRDHAVAVLARKEPLLAPPHFRIELVSAVMKKIRAGDLQRATIAENLAAIANAPVREVSGRCLHASAMEIALRFYRSIYDSLYVALALQERCQLVTADRKLYDAVAPHYAGTMLWIEAVPPAPGP